MSSSGSDTRNPLVIVGEMRELIRETVREKDALDAIESLAQLVTELEEALTAQMFRQSVEVQCDEPEHARLIAAAPDLLAACMLAVQHFEPICDPRKDTVVLARIQAAIAKAEGAQ